jgi:exodeoxyribonuclease V alpha subunit
METVRGVLERITYQNDETGYTVARLSPDPVVEAGARQRPPQPVTVVGALASVAVGEYVTLDGHWIVHPDYGRQFVAEQVQTALPVTLEGIEKYLGSGLIRGVGPVMAQRLVKRFGINTLEVIEKNPEKLTDVPGIGRKRIDQIVSAWHEQRAIKHVMLFLQSHNVSAALAARIYKAWGEESVAKIQADPYRLAAEVYGVGFVTADAIAHALGITAADPKRVAAGIAYTLGRAIDEGNVLSHWETLLADATTLLHVAPGEVAAGLLHGWAVGDVVLAESPGGEAIGYIPAPDPSAPQNHPVLAQGPVIYLAPFYYAEVGSANGLRRLLMAPRSRLEDLFSAATPWDMLIADLEREFSLTYAPHQRSAIETALTRRVAVLTGGPGTGKTTTLRAVLELCVRHGKQVLLAAPTGRAAKRLAESTGQEARTIHRMLEVKRGGDGLHAFSRNDSNPLEADLLIVDEASMLDMLLLNHLVKALPAGMHLLLVGDVDQLPSVGAGNVLRDVIGAIEEIQALPAPPVNSPLLTHPARGRAAVVRLDTIFRQQEGSYIISNAHRINSGEMPVLDNKSAVDFFIFRADSPARVRDLCVEIVHERIPRRFAIPPRDIQVLSPIHKGEAGVAALNEALQEALNPPHKHKGEKRAGPRTLRAGDRVMQLRNNYDKEVFNGDIGTVATVDAEQNQLTVDFDGRIVPYEPYELDELTHAFAVSVHKSQGSEYAAVVLPVLSSHGFMLQRNLLYTAVTRARRLVVLVGQPRAVAQAVRNVHVNARSTGLRERVLRVAFGVVTG